MILKLKLKNIDDNYAWHFVDGVENVAVEKTELGNIKSITYKKKGDPDVTNLVLYKESRGFLAAEAYILSNEGKTIENLVSSQSQPKTPSHKFSKTFGVVGFDKEIVVGNRDADDDVLAVLAQKSEKEGIPIVCLYDSEARSYKQQYPKADFISLQKFMECGRRFGSGVILYKAELLLDFLMPNEAKINVINYTVE